MADAAATIIANAVDLPQHPNVVSREACELAPTATWGASRDASCGSTDGARSCVALDAGERVTRRLLSRGLVRAAALHLGGETRTMVGRLEGKNPLLFHSRPQEPRECLRSSFEKSLL